MKTSTLTGNTTRQLRKTALLAALALGLLADAIIRTPGRPGLNVLLWALAGVAVLVVLVRRRGEPASKETLWFVGGALGFAAALALRDAEALAVFALFAAVALLLMAAGRAAAAWATRAPISDVAISVMRVVVLCAAGPFGWGRGEPNESARASVWSRRMRTVLRGTLMALPAVLLLGVMLMSADEVFGRLIERAIRVDLARTIQHVLFTAVIAWAAAGYLRAFMVRDDAVIARLHVPQPAFAAAEVTVALWILNLLFLAFMAVQVRYLFGGADIVAITPDLTYAEYARDGFFELVSTTALAIPILLLADWAAAADSARARTRLRASALVLVVLLIGVIVSAAYRMRIYLDAYGLTEDRLYASVFIAWLGIVLGWLVLTVLRGRRERFPLGAILAGFACIGALHVLNPDALIARVNLDRAAAGAEYDGTYLRRLSADAVPAILARLDQMSEDERCRFTSTMLERWSGERPGGWRTWNASDARARRLVTSLTSPGLCPAEPEL